ncbi:MAG: UDP-N-acetylmuramoyl-L-alanyl-D-glutamate--2,6-diaminopimelate ligase [Myxococcota bacterium]
MQLRTLLQDLTVASVQGNTSVDITGVQQDSRAVKAGNLFVAMPGATPRSRHGLEFVEQALANGAAAVLASEATPAVKKAKAYVVASDVPLALSVVAEAFHGNPSRKMRLLGVTGTNGKTTSAHLLEAMARAAGEKAGFIGTTAVRVGDEERPATHTTPPSEMLSALLAEMVQKGVRTAAMEVSSHALALHRVDGLRYGGAIFTNFTQDHLDFHETMDAYFQAKARLFTELLPSVGTAVLNIDDERVATLVGQCKGRVATISATGKNASLSAKRVDWDEEGTRILVDGEMGRFELRTPLVGTYNVANLLGAAALHLGTGTRLDAVIKGAAELKGVPGRLEAVKHPRGARVLVDYAHTPDALERALEAVRPYVATGGRLFCIFGCGGDRDPLKRPKMGAIAARLSDVAVLTNDNPRSEKPEAIADAILGGMGDVVKLEKSLRGNGVHVELDRAVAIARAVRAAGKGDVVLIAGKGHEREQIFADRKIPFDDRVAAAAAFEQGEER